MPGGATFLRQRMSQETTAAQVRGGATDAVTGQAGRGGRAGTEESWKRVMAHGARDNNPKRTPPTPGTTYNSRAGRLSGSPVERRTGHG